MTLTLHGSRDYTHVTSLLEDLSWLGHLVNSFTFSFFPFTCFYKQSIVGIQLYSFAFILYITAFIPKQEAQVFGKDYIDIKPKSLKGA